MATVGSAEKAEIAKARGADEAILYRDVDFREAVMTATEGEGVDVVYDSVGKATFYDSIHCLRPRGLCVLFGHASGKIESLNPLDLSEAGSIFFTRPHMAHYIRTREELDEGPPERGRARSSARRSTRSRDGPGEGGPLCDCRLCRVGGSRMHPALMHGTTSACRSWFRLPSL